MGCSRPDFHVLHYLPEFAQTQVHWVMPSNHLGLCGPFPFLPSVFPGTRVFAMSWFFASGGQTYERDKPQGATVKRRELRGFPLGSDCKESACHMGEAGSVPGSGRSSGEGNGNPLQSSCLERSLTCYSPWGCKESINTFIVGKNLKSIYISMYLSFLSL